MSPTNDVSCVYSYSLNPDIQFERTLAKPLLHKNQIENVYCTSISKIKEDEYAVGAFIPKANVFFRQCRENIQSNILLITEIGRQAAIAASHNCLSVEFDKIFILDTLNMHMLPSGLSDLRNKNNDLVIYVRLNQKTHDANGELLSVSTHFKGCRENKVIAEGVGSWSFLGKQKYERTRSLTRRRIARKASHTDPLDHVTFLQFSPVDYSKVLKEISIKNDNHFSTQLIIDREHIFFFDHDCDHVPGMLIFEAFKQLGCRAMEYKLNLPIYSMQANGIELNFRLFAELDYKVVISANTQKATVDPNSGQVECIQLRAEQSGQLVAEAQLRAIIPPNMA